MGEDSWAGRDNGDILLVKQDLESSEGSKEAVQPIMTSSQCILPASSLHPGAPEQIQWSPWLTNYSISREGPQVLSLGTARAENPMLELMAPSPLKPINRSGGKGS